MQAASHQDRWCCRLRRLLSHDRLTHRFTDRVVRQPQAIGAACSGRCRATRECRVAWWLLHKPLTYPVRYDEVQRVDFAGDQKSRKDPSIVARRPYRAPADKSHDARLEILQRPHLCATATMESDSRFMWVVERFGQLPPEVSGRRVRYSGRGRHQTISYRHLQSTRRRAGRTRSSALGPSARSSRRKRHSSRWLR
jgi:hypothetical protein